MVSNSEADSDYWKQVFDEKASKASWDKEAIETIHSSSYTHTLNPAEECPHCGEYKFEAKIWVTKKTKSNGFLKGKRSYWEADNCHWRCDNCKKVIHLSDYTPTNFIDNGN